MTSNESLDTLSPAAKLALLHAQAANPSTNQQVEQDPFVPSPDDPVVVMDNSAYEPLIAGDFPTPIGKPISSIPAPKKEPATKKKLDLNSEAAFPSLSASPRAPVASGWSSAASSRVKAPQGASGSPRSRPMAPASGGVKKTAATQVTDVLELPANQQISNMSSKPLGFKSSADVIQQVINKTGTNIIASTNRSGTTTFLIQGTPNDVARAKRELIAGLVVKVSWSLVFDGLSKVFIVWHVAYRRDCRSCQHASLHHWCQGCQSQANWSLHQHPRQLSPQGRRGLRSPWRRFWRGCHCHHYWRYSRH